MELCHGHEISVVVCTRNRSKLLRLCLDSLTCQTLPQCLFEVIIVDNGSTDDTRAVSEEYCNRNSNFHYEYEPTVGLSSARNTGLKCVHSNVVAYIDDDAVAAPEWLAILNSSFKSAPASVGIIAGKVDPLWQEPPPAWLKPSFWHLFSVLNLGDTPRLLTETEWFVGANMSIRRKLLTKVGGFNVALGRSGNSLLSNEELEMAERVRLLGSTIYYQPQAVVANLVPKERATKRWLRKRMYWQGVSFAKHQQESHTEVPKQRDLRLKQLLVTVLLLAEGCTTTIWHRFTGNLETELGWHYRLGITLQKLACRPRDI